MEVEGIPAEEGRTLIAGLCAHAQQPDFLYRHRWLPGDAVLWDNRCTQHYAVMDYPPCHRKMNRATIIGDRPY